MLGAMVIFVDERSAVSLTEADDLKGFKVVTRAPRTETNDALSKIGAKVDGEHAWIPESWVRSSADKDQAWQTSFDGVVAYAKKKEWFDDAHKSIRAHIEWADKT